MLLGLHGKPPPTRNVHHTLLAIALSNRFCARATKSFRFLNARQVVKGLLFADPAVLQERLRV